MAKYRGFMNEPGLGIWAAQNGGGGYVTTGGAFTARRVYSPPAPAPVAPPVVAYAPPPVVAIPFDYGGVPVPTRGIPGDIRPITARILPGEAIVDVPDEIDLMGPETGVPGVDDSGGFPYGDPKAPQKAGAKIAPGNQALILAAIAAALLLGG